MPEVGDGPRALRGQRGVAVGLREPERQVLAAGQPRLGVQRGAERRRRRPGRRPSPRTGRAGRPSAARWRRGSGTGRRGRPWSRRCRRRRSPRAWPSSAAAPAVSPAASSAVASASTAGWYQSDGRSQTEPTLSSRQRSRSAAGTASVGTPGSAGRAALFDPEFIVTLDERPTPVGCDATPAAFHPVNFHPAYVETPHMAGCAVGRGSRREPFVSASTQLESGVTGDAELISSARSGDAAAIGALYERHAGAALGGRPAVLGLPGGRRRRRRRLVHRRLRCHPAGQRARVGVPRLPLHRRAPRGGAAAREEPSRPADGRHRRARGRDRAGRHRGGAGARRLRAGGRRARVPLAARAVAGRAVAHRGRGPDARRRSRPSSGSPPTAWPPWRTARARACGRRTSSSTCRTRSTRAAGPSRASSAPTCAAGWARARPAQVEAHLEDCGTCRGLLLELGRRQPRHARRHRTARARPARARRARRGCCPSAAGSRPAPRRPVRPVRPVRAGARWRGGRRRDGSGCCGDDRDASPRSAPVPRAVRPPPVGVAAFLAAIPLGVAAVVVGGVALAAVAAVAIAEPAGRAGRRDGRRAGAHVQRVPEQLARADVQRGASGPDAAAHGHPDARAQRRCRRTTTLAPGRRATTDDGDGDGDGRRPTDPASTRRPRRPDGARRSRRPRPTRPRRRPRRCRSTCRPAGSPSKRGSAARSSSSGCSTAAARPRRTWSPR